MKFLFDLFPVILFFAVFKIAGLHYTGLGLTAAAVSQQATQAATIAAILGTLLQVGWVWWRTRRLGGTHLLSLALVILFGGATLLFHDARFIQMKPTALYWLFALGLTLSRYLFAKNLIRTMMQEHIQAPEWVWDRLNLAWAGFFAVLGAVNLYVAHFYSLNAWVNFKLFGTFGLMIIFVIAQAAALSRYIPDDKENP